MDLVDESNRPEPLDTDLIYILTRITEQGGAVELMTHGYEHDLLGDRERRWRCKVRVGTVTTVRYASSAAEALDNALELFRK